MFIFDCNGVLVDSEAIVANVAATELTRAGFAVSPEIVARFFAGRRPADMLADLEVATQRKLPTNFASMLAGATLRRLREEVRATAHVAHALTWLRGPKCVASSLHRPHPDQPRKHRPAAVLRTLPVFGDDVPIGKPAPGPVHSRGDEDARRARGLHRGRGFAGRRFGGARRRHGSDRLDRRQPQRAASRRPSDHAGARAVIADMRALKSTVVALRGW